MSQHTTDAHVARLVEMGFDARAALAALHDAGTSFDGALGESASTCCPPPPPPPPLGPLRCFSVPPCHLSVLCPFAALLVDNPAHGADQPLHPTASTPADAVLQYQVTVPESVGGYLDVAVSVAGKSWTTQKKIPAFEALRVSQGLVGFSLLPPGAPVTRQWWWWWWCSSFYECSCSPPPPPPRPPFL